MKKYEPADPKDISSLRIVTVMANPDGCSYLIEKRRALFTFRHCPSPFFRVYAQYREHIENVKQLYGNIPYNSLNIPNDVARLATRSGLYFVVLHVVYCIRCLAGSFCICFTDCGLIQLVDGARFFVSEGAIGLPSALRCPGLLTTV